MLKTNINNTQPKIQMAIVVWGVQELNMFTAYPMKFDKYSSLRVNHKTKYIGY